MLSKHKLSNKLKKFSRPNVYSNFITPPDFVDEDLHTVLVVDSSHEDIELLVRMCEHSDEMFNIYLYKSDMGVPEWLDIAIEKSAAVIVNAENKNNHWLCKLEKTHYYGPNRVISPAQYIETPLHYFTARQLSE